VRFTVMALNHAGWTPGMSASQLRSVLLATVRKKLENRIDPVDDDVLERLID